jgi:hypothetical protein
MSGSLNGSLTQLANSASGDHAGGIWVKHGITGGAETMTATYSGAARGTMGCTEVSGAGASLYAGPNVQAAPGTGTNAITAGSVTTTQANAYCSAITINLNAGTGAIAAGTGWTSGASTDGGYQKNWEDQIKSTAGSVSGTFTAYVSDGGNTYGTVLGCVEASGGGGGGVGLHTLGLLQVGK